METLLRIEHALFYFVNRTLENPLFDVFMPWFTDLNKTNSGRVLLLSVIVFGFWKGTRGVRTGLLLLIPTIVLSDKLNSEVFKHLFDRPRPCRVLEDVHLLVHCGSGYSFPSSHASNAFAAALVMAVCAPRGRWAFLALACTIAFSRVYVGVHYVSDVSAGALVGLGCGGLVLLAWRGYRLRRERRLQGTQAAEQATASQAAAGAGAADGVPDERSRLRSESM